MKKKYSSFTEGNVCSICGSTEWKFNNKEEIRDNVKIHVISSYKCLGCGHVGNELMNENVYKNIKRTKLIDKVLDGVGS